MANTQPWNLVGGATNFTRGEAQKFARQIVESEDYRTWLSERVKDHSLAAPIEQMLWYYAYGKPVEQVNVQVAPDLSGLSVEELMAAAKRLSEELDEAKQLADAIPAEFKVA